MTNIIEIICENLGGKVEVPMGTPLSEVAKRVAPGPYPFLAALVNNRIKELYYKIYTPVSVRFVDITSFSGIRVYQRTSWFILQRPYATSFRARRSTSAIRWDRTAFTARSKASTSSHTNRPRHSKGACATWWRKTCRSAA